MRHRELGGQQPRDVALFLLVCSGRHPRAGRGLWEDQLVTLDGVSVAPVVRVREAVHEQLGNKGWSILDDQPISLPHRRVSAVALRDGWFATLRVDDWLEDDEHETPINFAAGVLGLDYEPARRITVALTGAPRSGVVVKDPLLSIALSDETEADAPVASLVGFATKHLDSLSKLADVDTVIGMLHDHRAAPASAPTPFVEDERVDPPPGYPELTDPVTEFIPALLAGAGRYEEARRALALCEDPHWQEIASANDRRILRQLTRWVDRGGGLGLPSTPARWPAKWPPPASGPDPSRGFKAFMAEQRPEILARREAISATRAASEGKSRGQIRELLSAELGKRSVKMQPVEFEQNIDFLVTQHEPFGKARLAVRGFKALTDLISNGSGLVDAIRDDRDPQDEPDPAWAKTPDRAGYPMWSVIRERVAVELDTGAEPRLAELMSGSRGQFGNRNVEVWLSHKDPGLTVHIGSKQIGRLDAHAAMAFRGAIEAAADRDEDVRTDAHLTRMTGTPQYVLDLPLYDSGTSPA